MKPFHKIFVIVLSGIAFSAAGVGVYYTLHSPLFLVRVVEVVDQPEKAPVDSETLIRLAAVPIGKVNLFELNLADVEQRLLQNSWIKAVTLQKQFPQTLSIAARYRQPKALLQTESGGLSYVDGDGTVFGQVNLNYQPDLPVFTGFVGDDQFRVLDGLHLLEIWQSSSLSHSAEVASVAWDAERGFRVLLTYGSGPRRLRATVDLGQESEENLTVQFKRLERVFDYLYRHSIAARQIWADAGKKIVVKTAKGS